MHLYIRPEGRRESGACLCSRVPESSQQSSPPSAGVWSMAVELLDQTVMQLVRTSIVHRLNLNNSDSSFVFHGSQRLPLLILFRVRVKEVNMV